MAGHSKWANTKHRKTAQDMRRSKVFTKITKELVISAKLGGNNPNTNPRLRALMDKALSNNMTRYVINRAISRGVGGEDKGSVISVTYEGYGPGGCAVMVQCFSDNRNSIICEIRHAFTKFGGSLGTEGCVSYLFKKIGIIYFIASKNEEKIIETVLNLGAEDIEKNDDGTIMIFTEFTQLHKVSDALKIANLEPDSIEFSMLASNKVKLNVDNENKLMSLINTLENYHHVEAVYHNAYINNKLKISDM